MEKTVHIGYQVYLDEGAESFGSVTHVTPHELTIDIEGHGQVTLTADQISAVHDGKIIVEANKLSTKVRAAIKHAHDAEDGS